MFQKDIQNLRRYPMISKHIQRYPKISKDIQRYPKISKDILPSAASRMVGAAMLSRMRSARDPPKVGAAARASKYVMKGIPLLCNQVARLPKSTLRPMRTTARKASWAGAGMRLHFGGMLRAAGAWLVLGSAQDVGARGEGGGVGAVPGVTGGWPGLSVESCQSGGKQLSVPVCEPLNRDYGEVFGPGPWSWSAGPA